MTYVPITKLEKFTSEKNDAQAWLNDVTKAITANNWNDDKTLQTIPYFLQDTKFLRYFSNNNSINHLVNTFIIIKQEDTEAITMYLEQFHRCLCQIQAINADYFTVAQILNQFIKGLHSSILQCIYLLHPADLQAAITNARDFKAAELKANHAQAINLVMNGSFELDSKLKQFSNSINQKLEGYLADNQGNSNHVQNQPRPSFPVNQQWQQETCVCHYCDKQRHIQINCHQHLNNQQSENQYQNPNHWFPVLSSQQNQEQYQHLSYYAPIMQQSMYQPPPQVIYQQPQPQIIYQPQQIQTLSQNLPPNRTQRPRMTQQSSRSAIVVHQLILSSSQQPSELCQQNSSTSQLQNLNFQNYLSFLVIPEDASANNLAFAQKQPLISNIPSATITENEFLAAIFPFEFKETTAMLLFSGATLKAKLIIAMYTDAKVEGQFIKLILDSTASARIITADGATKTPISKIDDFSFEINGIVTSIKVLVMETTQYQALIGNNWLFQVNAMLD
ncbi:hypothetical protein G9A89_003210 [Geosiphon pyriformis]|nr:hypothetical protein G9A89_003210 [Geosiphon pyriformis]